MRRGRLFERVRPWRRRGAANDRVLASAVGMTEDELRLLEQIVDVHDAIRAWGLKSNVSEFTHAVHTLQLFVLNRMLHRQRPEFWSTWYHERPLGRLRAAARVAGVRRRRRRRSRRLARR